MAYVKVKFRKSANSLIQYVFREKAPEDPAYGQMCEPEAEPAKRAFADIRNLHGDKEGKEAFHVVQSWSPEESKKLTPQQINQMGQKLAASYFEGYQYLVVTHTHDEHFHNHIVLNPVHPDTGKRFQDKKKHLYKLRELSDAICRENGLSVIDGDAKQRRENVPDRVQRIEQRNGNSYVYAMKDYARFSRQYATSFDEYAAYLDAFGVKLRIKDESITYFYEDKKKGKRGDKLGREFTRESLEGTFKRNDALFTSRPELRARIRSEFERGLGASGSSMGDPGRVLLDGRGDAGGLGKDYKAYTKSSRTTGDRSRPTDDKLRNSIIPIEAIRRARDADLVQYCVRNKIELTTNQWGNRALKGRELVEIGEKGWTNRKNRTKGTALEFAAIHGNLSYVQALAQINEMPALLELERAFGPVERKFKSFYVPRPTEASYHKAIERTGRFLTSFGVDPNAARALYQGGGIEARKNGTIRLFAKDDYKNALEFTEQPDGSWAQKRRGKFKKPYYASRGTSDRMVIFGEPKAYIQKRGKDLHANRVRKDGILVLMEPNVDVVAGHLRDNPQVKEVEIVTRNPSKPEQGELDFFGNLKSRLKGLGVNVRLTGYEQALRRRAPEVEIGSF